MVEMEDKDVFGVVKLLKEYKEVHHVPPKEDHCVPPKDDKVKDLIAPEKCITMLEFIFQKKDEIHPDLKLDYSVFLEDVKHSFLRHFLEDKLLHKWSEAYTRFDILSTILWKKKPKP